MNWREESGLHNSTLEELKIFSPYYDHDSGMLRKFTETLLPNIVNLYVSRENTTLNGQALLSNWPKGFPEPQLFDISESRDNKSHRLLHGKLIIGIEDTGSWCIAGSANMTRAAFESSWKFVSNLEMVTFRWSPDPTTFDYLLDRSISLSPIEVKALTIPELSNYSEDPTRVTEETILITELTLNNKTLTGRLNHWPSTSDNEVDLILERSEKRFPIKINYDLSFQTTFPDVIQTSESVFIRGEGIQTLPRWIDIPASLLEYGSRSYHERIQAKLDTIAGAEALFHELLDFLFDRVIPDQPITKDSHRSSHRSENSHLGDEDSESSPTPDVERFVVPERDPSGLFRIGKFTRLRYDHNIRSLRDLLSVVLLRLTSTPIISTETKFDEDREESQGDETNSEDTEAEECQINARQRLCDYLVSYCNKYSKHLCDINFIEKISPEILFDNHLTLSRVLLEFNSHIIEFSADDFQQCYWLIWAPLFSPSLVGLKEKSSWQLFVEREMEELFSESWNRLGVYSVLIVMTSMAMGQPLTWASGLHKPKEVSKFLALKQMLLKVNSHLPIFLNELNKHKNFGIQTVDWDECVRVFTRIIEYLPPARERLTPIFDWIENSQDQTELAKVTENIKKGNLSDEFALYKEHPKEICGILTEPDFEGLIYCPRCGGALRTTAINRLLRGKLVLCSTNSDAWLYKTENPLQLVI